jgi:TorA maturation chaperone TorD
MQMDRLTEQAADKSLPHVVVGDVVTTAVTDRWAGMLFYREPTSVELHRKHTNP